MSTKLKIESLGPNESLLAAVVACQTKTGDYVPRSTLLGLPVVDFPAYLLGKGNKQRDQRYFRHNHQNASACGVAATVEGQEHLRNALGKDYDVCVAYLRSAKDGRPLKHRREDSEEDASPKRPRDEGSSKKAEGLKKAKKAKKPKKAPEKKEEEDLSPKRPRDEGSPKKAEKKAKKSKKARPPPEKAREGESPARPSPAQLARPSPVEQSPARPSPAQLARPSPAKPSPVEPSPAKPSPAKPSPAEQSPAKPSPEQSPAKPSPAEQSPAQLTRPSPARPSPVQRSPVHPAEQSPAQPPEEKAQPAQPPPGEAREDEPSSDGYFTDSFRNELADVWWEHIQKVLCVDTITELEQQHKVGRGLRGPDAIARVHEVLEGLGQYAASMGMLHQLVDDFASRFGAEAFLAKFFPVALKSEHLFFKPYDEGGSDAGIAEQIELIIFEARNARLRV